MNENKKPASGSIQGRAFLCQFFGVEVLVEQAVAFTTQNREVCGLLVAKAFICAVVDVEREAGDGWIVAELAPVAEPL